MLSYKERLETFDFFVATNRVYAWGGVIQIKMAPIGRKLNLTLLEKTLVHVTLMTFPNWLRRTRAPTNCLSPPHTSRQGPTRRFEI